MDGSATKKDYKQPLDKSDDGLVDLIEALDKVDLNSPMAKLNETTISDNNGGRIQL